MDLWKRFGSKEKESVLKVFEKNIQKNQNERNMYDAFVPKVRKLIAEFPSINYVSMSYYRPSISFKDDVELPPNFYCFCEKNGLVIDNVDNRTSYGKGDHYYNITFSLEASFNK